MWAKYKMLTMSKICLCSHEYVLGMLCDILILEGEFCVVTQNVTKNK